MSENDLDQYLKDSDVGLEESEAFDYKAETLAWWTKILLEEDRLNAWLCRLHNTEKEAEERFIEFAKNYCTPGTREDTIFRAIADQEKTHAAMIERVLVSRGVVIDPAKEHPARYWKYIEACITGKETAAAAGYFAEDLSLQRMQVIIDYDGTPEVLSDMFIPIHKDEGYHTRILAKLAGEHGISEVVDCHTEGLKALGLSIKRGEI